ncbi:MAG: hypothetical protein WDW36_007251 [Sanguina aurantia]
MLAFAADNPELQALGDIIRQMMVGQLYTAAYTSALLAYYQAYLDGVIGVLLDQDAVKQLYQSASALSKTFATKLTALSPSLGNLYSTGNTFADTVANVTAGAINRTETDIQKRREERTLAVTSEMQHTMGLLTNIVLAAVNNTAHSFKELKYLPLAEVHSAVDALNQTVDGIISQLQAATVKLEGQLPGPAFDAILAAASSRIDTHQSQLLALYSDLNSTFPGPLLAETVNIINAQAGAVASHLQDVFDMALGRFPALNTAQLVQQVNSTVQQWWSQTVDTLRSFHALSLNTPTSLQHVTGQIQDAVESVKRSITAGQQRLKDAFVAQTTSDAAATAAATTSPKSVTALASASRLPTEAAAPATSQSTRPTLAVASPASGSSTPITSAAQHPSFNTFGVDPTTPAAAAAASSDLGSTTKAAKYAASLPSGMSTPERKAVEQAVAAVQAKAQNTTQRAEAALTQLTAALQQSVDHIDKALGFLKAASGASDASGSTDVGAATAPVPANGAGAGTLAERLSGVASALRASSSKDPVGSRLYNLTSAALDTVLKEDRGPADKS